MSYTVPPFSGKEYSKNSDRVTGDSWPCAICGRAIKEPKLAVWAGVNADGTWAVDSDGDQGSFPVGPDCHRKYRVSA